MNEEELLMLEARISGKLRNYGYSMTIRTDGGKTEPESPSAPQP